MKVVKLAVDMVIAGRQRVKGEIVTVPDDFNHGTVAETIALNIDKPKDESSETE